MAEDLFSGFAQGFATGSQIDAMRQRSALLQATRQKAEQEALMQKNMYDDLTTAHAITDPRLKIKTLTDLAIKYPTISTKLNESSKLISSEQKDNVRRNLLPAYNALTVGKTDIALQKLTEQEQAFRNAGDSQQADQLKNYIESVKNAPDQALTTGTMYMMNMLGVDEFKSMYDPEATRKIIALPFEQRKTIAETLKSEGEAERQPFLTQEAQAKAMQEGVKAKYAESQALLDLENKGWNIKKLKNDIDVSRQNARIAAMNASINAQGNEYKKQELQLKMQDAIAKRDETIKAKTAEVESKAYFIKDGLDLIRNIKKDKDALTGALGASAWMGSVPGSKERTASAKLEQLTNSLTTENLALMKGVLTDKDIAFLKSVATTLSDRYQDEASALKEIDKVEGIFTRNAKSLSNRFGVPLEFFQSGETPKATMSSGSQITKIPPRPAGAVKPLGAK